MASETQERMAQRRTAEALRREGRTYREIGAAMGFTSQYAVSLVQPPPATRDRLKARAAGCCEMCGAPTASGHVHHQNDRPDLDINDILNLEYLCASCHMRRHYGHLQPKPAKEKNPYAVTLGKSGGLTAARNMTKAERVARATKASQAAAAKRRAAREPKTKE